MDALIIFAGGIFVLGIIVAVFLISRNRRRHRAILHYEKIRDELTLRKEEVPEPEEVEELTVEFGGGFNLVSLFTGLVVLGIVITIGFTIMSSLQETFVEGTEEYNLTSEMFAGTEYIFNWFPVIMMIMFALVTFSVVMKFFRGAPELTSYTEAKKGVEKYKDMRDKLTKKHK